MVKNLQCYFHGASLWNSQRSWFLNNTVADILKGYICMTYGSNAMQNQNALLYQQTTRDFHLLGSLDSVPKQTVIETYYK